MKKMKQVVTGLLLAALLLSCLAGLPALRLEAKAASESDLTFKLNSAKDGYIVSKCDQSATGDLVIPATYQGLPVTEIEESVFKHCEKLTSITMPDSITDIGEAAFSQCRGLTSITISNKLTSIGRDVFYNCRGLTGITIPGSVTSIDRHAFYSCRELKEIYFEGSAPEIDEEAFSNVTATAYYYPDDSWTEDVMQDYGGDITWVARDNSSQGLAYTLSADGTYYIVSGIGTCTDTDLVIPATYKGLPVKEIGASAFRNNTKLTSVTIPEGVKTIGNYAFSDCTGLTSVTLPDSLESIGQSAFYKCSGLTAISIPSNIKSIGYHAFYNCTGLRYNTYENAYYLGNAENPYVVLVKAKAETIEFCTIHPDTRILYCEAFMFCSNLTELTIPEGVIELGPYLFDGCGSSLKEIYFDGSAPNFGDDLFSTVTATAYYYPDDTWTEAVMQDYGGTITWVSRSAPGQSVTVTYRTFGDASDTLTVEIFPAGATEAVYRFTSTASSANSGSWTVEGVASGSYTVKAEKANHVTREYTLTVGDTAATLEVTLCLLGDVNGDGRVNFTDYGKVLSQVKDPGAAALEGYGLTCADVNGDGKVNFTDYGKILSQAKGSNTLW